MFLNLYSQYTITELQTLLEIYTYILNEYKNDEITEFNSNIIRHFENELIFIRTAILIYNNSL